MRKRYLYPALLVLGTVRPALGGYIFSTVVDLPAGMGNMLGNLVPDSNGNLYTTESSTGGTTTDSSAIVELPLGSNSLTTLATLTFNTGYYPDGGVIFDAAGNLYGSGDSGGGGPLTNPGTLFELPAGANSVTTLAVFNYTNGLHPGCTPIIDGSGNLYGTTYNGGNQNDQGVLYEYIAASHSIISLANFNGTDGDSPTASPLLLNGNLLGTTETGGAKNDGVIYKYSIASQSLSVVASFNGTNGNGSNSNLIADSQGNLYGTAIEGGASNDGTIFKIPVGSNSIQVLASFGGSNGADPNSGLYMDSAGDLFGTTEVGGAHNVGVVYELTAGSNSITILHSFDGLDGEEPEAALYADANGDLFGTTEFGGPDWVSGGAGGGYGTVFELTNVPEPSAIFVLPIAAMATLGARKSRRGPNPVVTD
jgi:uncharacterized repeat protein (TIGR03803 family)